MFTYDDLEQYSELVNEVGYKLADLKETMSGAFPDNERSVDTEIALRKAELLLRNAEALRNEIKALHHSVN